MRWLYFRSPDNVTTHLFGSRVVYGFIGSRFQILISPRARVFRDRRFSFGFGPRSRKESR